MSTMERQAHMGFLPGHIGSDRQPGMDGDVPISFRTSRHHGSAEMHCSGHCFSPDPWCSAKVLPHLCPQRMVDALRCQGQKPTPLSWSRASRSRFDCICTLLQRNTASDCGTLRRLYYFPAYRSAPPAVDTCRSRRRECHLCMLVLSCTPG
jgi:hypothetical protein